ncbi:FAD-binding oxidoreductase [Streptomyces sp. NPDC059690]|uniref:FAD-binding oxidoreductase n=1 Tax=Streptomyces sp. NPDC059690 TaxID=3346907 RepID=UPI0036758D86
MTSTPSQAAQRELADFTGELIGPEDSGYEQARAVYNAMIDRRPALVARCADADAVARVIGFARAHDLPLAVRGGGHHGAGMGTVDGGVVADLSPMKEIHVDPEARTVTVGGGCVWGEVDRATHAHGLATPSGIVSTTGVGGLATGGGLGHLTRKCGLTIDNILSADVVLADGRQVRASADENSDLFWALRGGGGNFGVVTSFRLRLHEIDTVVAGPTFWPVEIGADVLAAYRDFLPNAPRDLNAFFLYGTVPPAPPFPEEIQLRKTAGVVWCHTGGDPEAAAREMAPLLDALPEPMLHAVGPMPHPDLQSMFDGLYPPGHQWYWRADFVEEIPDEAVELHAKFGAEVPTIQSTMHLYPIDGAAHDVGPDETPWGYRSARWSTVYAGVDPDPANAELIKRWAVDYSDALHPYSAGGAYVNMMMDEGQERIRASYGGNYARLARVKADLDPDNVFRLNQNIRPT